MSYFIDIRFSCWSQWLKKQLCTKCLFSSKSEEIEHKCNLISVFVVGSPSTPRKDPHHFLEAQDRKDLSKGGQESGYSTPEGQQQKPKKVIYEVVVWCVLLSYTSYFIQKINQSEKEEMSCDFKTELICRLKWSRSDRTIPWEFDLELILVRWHGNSELVAFMNVTLLNVVNLMCFHILGM